MTKKDLDLIDRACKAGRNYEYVGSLIMQADTDDAKEILADMEMRSFIRHEQAYGEEV